MQKKIERIKSEKAEMLKMVHEFDHDTQWMPIPCDGKHRFFK